MKNLQYLNWAVVATRIAKNNGKIESHERIIAIFDYAHLAQDYIDKCLPPENRDRFKIERI